MANGPTDRIECPGVHEKIVDDPVKHDTKYSDIGFLLSAWMMNST